MRTVFVSLVAAAALSLSACRGGCCPPPSCCEDSVVVVAQDGAEVTTHRSPGGPTVIVVRTGKSSGAAGAHTTDKPLPPTPFKTFKLKHNDGTAGHKRIESSTVTGKGGPGCTSPDRFPPPPGTAGPPHQLVVVSAPLDFGSTAWWPGQAITTDPQAVYSAAFEIRFEGDPLTYSTCLAAPGNKELRSIAINFTGMQNGQYHFDGKIIYYDSFDAQGNPRYAEQAIDLLLP